MLEIKTKTKTKTTKLKLKQSEGMTFELSHPILVDEGVGEPRVLPKGSEVEREVAASVELRNHREEAHLRLD